MDGEDGPDHGRKKKEAKGSACKKAKTHLMMHVVVQSNKSRTNCLLVQHFVTIFKKGQFSLPVSFLQILSRSINERPVCSTEFLSTEHKTKLSTSSHQITRDLLRCRTMSQSNSFIPTYCISLELLAWWMFLSTPTFSSSELLSS